MGNSFTRALAVSLCAVGLTFGAMGVAGCTTDGHAGKASSGQTAGAETAAPTSSAVRGSSARSSESASTRSSDPDTAESSPAATSSDADSGSTSSGVAARAWAMTCSDYQQLAPEEKKQVTTELGRRMNKKELRDGDRSWAIVASFCTDGLVRNSPGVQDSQ